MLLDRSCEEHPFESMHTISQDRCQDPQEIRRADLPMATRCFRPGVGLIAIIAFVNLANLVFVGPKTPKNTEKTLRRALSREEMLLSGEGVRVMSGLTAVKQEDMYVNTAIALAGIAFFGYMSYVFWTRIAFGKPFGTLEPVIIPKPEDAFAPKKKKKRPVGIKGKVSIGMDPDTNRGRKELGLDALIFAYLMFASAAAMLVFGAAAAYYPILSGQIAMGS